MTPRDIILFILDYFWRGQKFAQLTWFVKSWLKRQKNYTLLLLNILMGFYKPSQANKSIFYFNINLWNTDVNLFKNYLTTIIKQRYQKLY